MLNGQRCAEKVFLSLAENVGVGFYEGNNSAGVLASTYSLGCDSNWKIANAVDGSRMSTTNLKLALYFKATSSASFSSTDPLSF
jgi:hypothetical protein